MDVYFQTARMAKDLNSDVLRPRKHGDRRAAKLKLRLGELRAAATLADVFKLPAARCHQLKADKDECFSVDLDHPYRLIFEADHDPVPRRADGGIDVEAVTAVLVTGIEDTH
jgi:plasmid maintenance system killer protein